MKKDFRIFIRLVAFFVCSGTLLAQQDSVIISRNVDEVIISDTVLKVILNDFINSNVDSCGEGALLIKILPYTSLNDGVNKSIHDSIYRINEFPGKRTGHSYKFIVEFIEQNKKSLFDESIDLYASSYKNRRIFICGSRLKITLPSVGSTFRIERKVPKEIYIQTSTRSCSDNYSLYLLSIADPNTHGVVLKINYSVILDDN